MSDVPPPRRFRVSIGEVMGLVALAALACVWPGMIPTQILVVAAWVQARDGSEVGRARLVSLGVVLAAVYLLPLANFLLPMLDPAWGGMGDYWRRWWWAFFPVVPGLPLAIPFCIVLSSFFPKTSLPMFVVFAVSSFTTAATVHGLTRLAGRTRRRRIVVAVLSFLGAGLISFVVTALFVLSSVG